MLAHKDFAAGRYNGPLGLQTMDAQWENLSRFLSDYEPTKSANQWKCTWRDLKCKVRARVNKLRTERQQTGNITTSSVPLTDLDRKMLAVIGTATSLGVREPGEVETGLSREIPPPVQMAGGYAESPPSLPLPPPQSPEVVVEYVDHSDAWMPFVFSEEPSQAPQEAVAATVPEEQDTPSSSSSNKRRKSTVEGLQGSLNSDLSNHQQLVSNANNAMSKIADSLTAMAASTEATGGMPAQQSAAEEAFLVIFQERVSKMPHHTQ